MGGLFEGMTTEEIAGKNRLLYGDNLIIMQEMPLACIDLIYLDPPFNSKRDYNLLYTKLTGQPVPEQAAAFCDTWELDAEKEEAARSMPDLMKQRGVSEYYVKFWDIWMHALRDTQPHLLAYLIYMVQRLLHMKAILKPTGSIYLHCDPTASHYIKVMMDGIFGHKNFRNEIIWKRTGAHGSARRWGPVHDVILFYTMSDNYTWNRLEQPHDEDYLDSKYRITDERGKYQEIVLTAPGTTAGESGKPWRGYDPSYAGRHWAVPQQLVRILEKEGQRLPSGLHEQLEALYTHGFIRFPVKKGGEMGAPRCKRYLDGGAAIQDVIIDIPPINSQATERLGYATQKPRPLLKRIIEASSNEHNVVFDPFCGCGTTIYSAVETNRHWIGCDIAILSVRIVQDVLTSKYHLAEGEHFDISGIPVSVDSAEELAKKDKFQFQHWFVELIGGFPTDKKVADRGIDGRLYFETRDGLLEVVLSVKGGGNIKPENVRELRGVLEREPKAVMGALLTLKEPSKAMREEAARAGMYKYNDVSYPRMQLLTVKDVLEDHKQLHTPSKVRTKIAPAQTAFQI